ncbi:hypothetical protein [Yoonia sp. BS5-3]|uniref:Roadblock/LAMTOR2 domain-containing protein n=1 Tax=Yoonia phaeophyticola TaxID=3137369 RepID=A0ABZ2V3E4_9RHOB
MNELTALTEKLAALAAEDEVYVAGARVISPDSGEVALAAILREIDNVVLERTLVFTIGEVEVSAIVAGRRLRGLLDITAGTAGADKVVGQVLSREEKAPLKAAGALLRLLCEGASRVTVRSKPAERFGTSADAGILATDLADIWDVDLDARPAPPVVRFMTANASSLTAYLYFEGGRTASEAAGETAPLQSIWDDQVTAFRKRQKELSSKVASGPHLTCLEGALGPGTAVAIAMAGDEVCLCTFAPDQIAALAASWQAITS